MTAYRTRLADLCSLLNEAGARIADIGCGMGWSSIALGSAFPHVAVVGEEGCSGPADSAWRWVIDPIDGTLNYLSQRGEFGVLIGLALGVSLVTGVLSRFNDAIVARVLVLLQQRFRLPPASWCWLGLGSEGRLEQTLATDQDNGLVFSASDDGEAQHARRGDRDRADMGMVRAGQP